MAFSLMTGGWSDELKCSVCLDVYEDPITLPCGHSFCHVCIKKHWKSKEAGTAKDCPNCRCVFPIKPKCKKNVTLASLVEHMKLRPREKVEELRCTKHRRPIQFYCKDDESLMCLMCTAGQHQNHKVVAVEIVHDELKGILTAKCLELSKSKQHHESQLHQLRQKVEKTQHSGRGTVDRMEKKRTELHKFVDKSVDLMKSRVIKRQKEKIFLLQKQMYKVKEQLNSLHEANSTLKTALQDLETISLILGYKHLIKRVESVSHFQSLKMAQPTVLDFSDEEKTLDLLTQQHDKFLKNIMKPVEHKTSELDHNSLRSLYGQTPRLDRNSANLWIKISQDLRTATLTGTHQPYPEHPDRFDRYAQVLSSESFSSGRHYWEVDVSLCSWCRIGICLNSMGRKGEREECVFGENPQSWCLQKLDNKYTATHNDQCTCLSVQGNPERFGFLLDYEEGELICFQDSRVLHVFRGNFMDPVKPAIGVYEHVDDSVQFCSLG